MPVADRRRSQKARVHKFFAPQLSLPISHFLFTTQNHALQKGTSLKRAFDCCPSVLAHTRHTLTIFGTIKLQMSERTWEISKSYPRGGHNNTTSLAPRRVSSASANIPASGTVYSKGHFQFHLAGTNLFWLCRAHLFCLCLCK